MMNVRPDVFDDVLNDLRSQRTFTEGKSPGRSGWNVRCQVRRNLPDTGDLIPETSYLIPSFQKSPCALALDSEPRSTAGGWEA